MPRPTRAKVKCSIFKRHEWITYGMYGGRLVAGTARYFDTWAEAMAHANKMVARVPCPLGGMCSETCDRTQNGCVRIWGPEADHAEAQYLNTCHQVLGPVWDHLEALRRNALDGS